jgi:hypothetical protein
VVNPFSKSSQACERLPESVVEDIKVRLCSIQPQSPELAGTQPPPPFKLLPKPDHMGSDAETDTSDHTQAPITFIIICIK